MHYRPDPPGSTPLGPREFRVLCPLCGSPYVCVTMSDDPKYRGDTEQIMLDARRLVTQEGEAKPFVLQIAQAVPEFRCTAGDCGYVGHATRCIPQPHGG